MRLPTYIVVTIATILLYVLAASYEIGNAATVQWGLIRAAFDLLFLVPLELLAFFFVAKLFKHSSQETFSRMFLYIWFIVLGVLALVGVGFVVLFVYALGGLPGVAH